MPSVGETGRSVRPPDPFEDGGGVGDGDTPFSKKYPLGCRCAIAAMRYRDLASLPGRAARMSDGVKAQASAPIRRAHTDPGVADLLIMHNRIVGLDVQPQDLR